MMTLKKNIIIMLLMPIWLSMLLIGFLIGFVIYPLILGYQGFVCLFDDLFEEVNND